MIRAILLLACILIFAPTAQAGVLIAGGADIKFETSSDGRNLETRTPLSLRAGYRFDQVDAYVEYSEYTASDGAAGLYVSRLHQEWTAWARHIFHREWDIAPFVAGGLGFQYDDVQTTLGSDVSKESGNPDPLLAAAGGVRINVWQRLEIELETRASYAATNSPNPAVGFGMVLGWSFE